MLRLRLIALCALPLVVVGGCTKKEPEPESTPEKKAEGEEKPAGEGTPSPETAEAKPPTEGLGVEAAAMIQSATAAAAAAPLLEHEGVLGHFMMGNAVESVKEIKEQAAPDSVKNMVDLEVLKSLTSMQLGERSSVAINVDLAKPFGCALVDSSVIDAPVACVVGYKGGAEALVTDLGSKDALPDAKGHVGAYTVEGQEVYIDAIGDQVALSNHPDLFGKAKDYLEANIVGRADEGIADFELVIYPNAAMTRYGDELKQVAKFLDDLSEDGPTSSTDLRKQVDEMDQLALGIGFTPAGAHFSVATHAKPGSELAAQFDSMYGGIMNVDFVGKLPMSAFVFAGMQAGTGLTESDNWKKGVELLAESMSKEFGMSADDLRKEVESFVEEEADLYTRDMVMGMLYEPGTLGALVLEVGKKAPGRDKWKAWSERFTTTSILPTEGQENIDWSFASAATTIEGVEIDRWSIQPTRKALEGSGSDPDMERIRKLWPDLTLRIDRAELDDRVIFVVAPTESDTYMQSAIKATRGGKTVRDRKGWDGLDAGRPSTTALYAIDVAGGIEWLRPLLDPSDAAEIPSPLGSGLDDVTMVLRHPAPGVIAGSFNVSQAFIDQLKPLADR